VIIYIDGKLDRDSLDYDEALGFASADPSPDLGGLLFWLLMGKYHGMSAGKVAA
jgi:hypothetical protein